MSSSQGPGADASDPLVGRVLDGRYHIEERIGAGGMGRVYRARHLRMEHAVAVKVLHADLGEDPTAARRFSREARRTFRFDHPHCVRVLDFGSTPQGLLFLVMEHLTGRTAGQELAVDGPMAPARVVHIARQVCDALAYAHELGFVHRDIKPDNLMLLHRGSDPDFVKVLDFGLAKLFAAPDALRTAAFSLSALTREGNVFGTPEYMSPEQAMGQPLAPTADVYSLGVAMYELLTASLPFQGDTFTAVLAQQVQAAPEPPAARRPDLGIPPPLNALVMACLAKAPGARPQSAVTLAAELDRLGATVGAPLPRVAPAVAASETLDLEASAVNAQAAAATHAGTRMGRARAATESPQATAATALMIQAPGPAAERAPATSRARSAAAASSVAARRPSRSRESPAPRGRSRWTAAAIAVAVTALLATGVVAALAWSRDSTPGHAAAPPRAMEADAAATRAATTAAHADTAPTARASAELGAPTAAGVPAAASAADRVRSRARAPDQPEPGAGDREGRARDRGEARRARRQQVARHLEAAAAARREGNHLRQMFEAESALRLAPGSREAAFLLGEALLASGDQQNACKYLRRARRLARARAVLRRAGCPSD